MHIKNLCYWFSSAGRDAAAWRRKPSRMKRLMEFVDDDTALGVFLYTLMDETQRILHSYWRAVKINEGFFFYRKRTTKDILVMTLLLPRFFSAGLGKSQIFSDKVVPSLFRPSFVFLSLQAQENVFVEFTHQELLELYNKVCLEVYRRLVFVSLSEVVSIYVLMSRQMDVTRFTCISSECLCFYLFRTSCFFHVGRLCPTNFNCMPVSFKQFALSLGLFFL